MIVENMSSEEIEIAVTLYKTLRSLVPETKPESRGVDPRIWYTREQFQVDANVGDDLSRDIQRCILKGTAEHIKKGQCAFAVGQVWLDAWKDLNA